MSKLSPVQQEINKINANIQYFEKTFGVDSDVTAAYVESLYTGETKKFFHKTKSGGVRISKSREAAEALEKFIPKMQEKKTAGQLKKEARGLGYKGSEAVSFVVEYNKANRGIESMLQELYAMSENGELPPEIEEKLKQGTQERNKEAIIEAFNLGQELIGE